MICLRKKIVILKIELCFHYISNIYIFFFTRTTYLHKGTFFKIEICIKSERFINNISIDVWFVMIGQYLKGCKKIFKVVQIKFLAMHINNQ